MSWWGALAEEEVKQALDKLSLKEILALLEYVKDRDKKLQRAREGLGTFVIEDEQDLRDLYEKHPEIAELFRKVDLDALQNVADLAVVLGEANKMVRRDKVKE